MDSERNNALEDSKDRIEQASQDLRNGVVEVSNCVRYGRHGNSSRRGCWVVIALFPGVKGVARLADKEGAVTYKLSFLEDFSVYPKAGRETPPLYGP